MQKAVNYQSVDEPRNGEEVSRRTWLKPAMIFSVVLVLCVGFLFVAGDNTNKVTSPNVALFAEKPSADVDNPMPAFESDPAEDIIPEVEEDSAPGSVVGRGVFWVPAPRGWNCGKVCGHRRMAAVRSGIFRRTRKPFFVCGARGTRRHPGMRTGFNLPGWNNGQCAIAYGRWVNRRAFRCLCRKPRSGSRWVSNQNRYSSCRRVCEKESPKMVAVSSGAFLGRRNNPRYEVCGACRGYDCRAGWNLGLIGWGNHCVSPWGRGYTRATGFKCFCARPKPCRRGPPKRCPVRVRVIRLGAFYRYWRAHGGDHFYTRNAREIGTTTPGHVGRYGYKSEGVACYLATRRAHGLVPLHRYWKAAGSDHFYTTNVGEIGTVRVGHVGRHGYKYEGIAGWCSPRAIAGTVPFWRYWNPHNSDHFYTTHWGELGAGRHGWGLEGIACYVWMKPRARLIVPGLVMEETKMMKGEKNEEGEEPQEGEGEDEELDANADLGEQLPETHFHLKEAGDEIGFGGEEKTA